MKIYKVIGLMSGTSLDGLDMVYCHLQDEEATWNYRLKATRSLSYSDEMRARLKNSINLNAPELLRFHNAYGTWLGEQAADFITKNNLEAELIASHGHTVHHQPDKGLTFQLGSGQHLANASGVKTICDFRSNDVALGGQGAPLVPIGDELFFNKYDFCLNLGGISNISFQQNGSRIAFDIGLANMVLNHLTGKVGIAYDKDGDMARRGTLNGELLSALNGLEYYRLPFPKSTGYEWFKEQVVPLIDGCSDTLENVLHTSVVHISEQIAIQVRKQFKSPGSKLLVTGGGALNGFLMETLQQELGTEVQVVIPPKELVEFKEALVFALMGVLRLQGKTNVLNSVTGAARDSSSGVVYLPA